MAEEEVALAEVVVAGAEAVGSAVVAAVAEAVAVGLVAVAGAEPERAAVVAA